MRKYLKSSDGITTIEIHDTTPTNGEKFDIRIEVNDKRKEIIRLNYGRGFIFKSEGAVVRFCELLDKLQSEMLKSSNWYNEVAKIGKRNEK